MARENPELKLKAALSLLEETSGQAFDIKGIREARARARDVGGGSWGEYWDSMKAEARVSNQVRSYWDKINLAIGLADEAEVIDPEATVVYEEEEVEFSPKAVKALAAFQKGFLSTADDKPEEALDYFEEAMRLFPTATYQLGLAYSIIDLGYRNQGIEALNRVIDLDPHGEDAIEATRELAELRSLRPKKKKVALWLSVLLGLAGVDRFYLGDIKGGLLKWVTMGGFYVWWIIDILRIATNNLKDGNGMRLE